MHLDLGDLEGPLLLFGGPYSNLQATRALLDVAARVGARPICTGDVMAYCADPGPTWDLLASAGVVVVAGNCERQLAAGAADCGCGFENGSMCDVLSAGWFRHAQAAVTDTRRAQMSACPDAVTFHHAGARYGVIHGGVRDIAQFIWPVSPEAVFEAEWAALETAVGPVDHIIAGHSGIPFARHTGRGQWINAGVIGMPPNDGSPDGRYALVSDGEVRFHRLAYDVCGAVSAMQAAGLTQGYERGLQSGYWPSEDVLPEALRGAVSASG